MYMLNYCSAGAVYRFYICRCSLSQRYGCACSWAAAASWSVQAALTTCLVLEGRSRKGRNDRKGSRIPVCAEAGLLLLCALLQRAASNSTFLPPHQRSRHRSPALHGMHTERRLHHNTAATKSVASLCSVCNLSCNEPLSCTPRLCMQHLSCSRVITIVRGSPLARSVTMLGATSSSHATTRSSVIQPLAVASSWNEFISPHEAGHHASYEQRCSPCTCAGPIAHPGPCPACQRRRGCRLAAGTLSRCPRGASCRAGGWPR